MLLHAVAQKVFCSGSRIRQVPSTVACAAAAARRGALRRFRGRRPAATGGQQQQQNLDRPASPLQGRPLRDLGPDAALVLSWAAAQNRSLLAAQSFVEAVLQCYQQGVTVDDLELGLRLSELEAAQGAPTEALTPQAIDLIVTWILVIMLTAQQLGLPFTPRPTERPGSSSSSEPDSSSGEEEAGGITRRHGPQSRGLRGFVQGTLMRYNSEGHTLSRVAALQAMTRGSGSGGDDPGSGGVSQAAEIMQQYTRLSLITLEVAAAAGLKINRPLQQPVAISAPTGYAAALLVTGDAAGDARALAVHLLVAFIGAVLGFPYSQRQFPAVAADAYSRGHSAEELLSQLRDEEFLQVGGLLPVAAPQPGAVPEITRQLFARWLSTAYFTFAELGATFPAAPDKPGWAWAGCGDAVEANALAAFVGQTLARVAAAEQEAAATGAAADAPVEADALAARIRSNPDAAEELKRVSQQLAEEMQEKGMLRGKPMPQMVRVADPSIGETSIALVVMRQQVELVERARALVLAEATQQQQAEDGGGGAEAGRGGTV